MRLATLGRWLQRLGLMQEALVGQEDLALAILS